jgi:L-glyceraldehyde 3-phosphate reductase
MGALAQIVKQGKALDIGISSFSPERTRKAYELLRTEGVHLAIHQPSYSMLNRHIETDCWTPLATSVSGGIGFFSLAQGLLTDKYIRASAPMGRGSGDPSFSEGFLSEENLKNVR